MIVEKRKSGVIVRIQERILELSFTPLPSENFRKMNTIPVIALFFALACSYSFRTVPVTSLAASYDFNGGCLLFP